MTVDFEVTQHDIDRDRTTLTNAPSRALSRATGREIVVASTTIYLVDRRYAAGTPERCREIGTVPPDLEAYMDRLSDDAMGGTRTVEPATFTVELDLSDPEATL